MGEETIALIFNCSDHTKEFKSMRKNRIWLTEKVFDGKVEAFDAAVMVCFKQFSCDRRAGLEVLLAARWHKDKNRLHKGASRNLCFCRSYAWKCQNCIFKHFSLLLPG